MTPEQVFTLHTKKYPTEEERRLRYEHDPIDAFGETLRVLDVIIARFNIVCRQRESATIALRKIAHWEQEWSDCRDTSMVDEVAEFAAVELAKLND